MIGNGLPEIVTDDRASAGERVHGAVETLLLAQDVVPSLNGNPELFKTINFGLAKVIEIPEYVPAGTLVLDNSSPEVIAFARFTVMGLDTNVASASPAFPLRVTFVI